MEDPKLHALNPGGERGHSNQSPNRLTPQMDERLSPDVRGKEHRASPSAVGRTRRLASRVHLALEMIYRSSQPTHSEYPQGVLRDEFDTEACARLNRTKSRLDPP